MLFGSTALIAVTAGVAIVLTVATMAAPVTSDARRRARPDLFAHSVVPIIVGYIGMADLQINYWLSATWSASWPPMTGPSGSCRDATS